MPLRLNGATSGYVQLAAPNAAGSTSLVLPTDSVQPGMVLVATSSFTTAATVSVDGCFTATYDSYQIRYEFSAVSGTDVGLQFRLRAAASDAATNYDEARSYLNASISGNAATGQTSWTAQVITTAQPDDQFGAWDIYRPALARKTGMLSVGRQRSNSGTQYVYTSSCIHTTASAYDGFTIYPASGTITGTLAVYGYRKA